ncbi:MAG: 23S rRNA (pseudouridine(1915)-N(3))-methyltransferase RlmH [Zoogloeaceae bacterium]|jgi:23S rRNA (pseudouridine1915-N3)-methyltransferase|nr:23S rRNA (pseudouridine(1915)-N(3))-methyltransferase RlmH [Zoogloeaceae bacterium]
MKLTLIALTHKQPGWVQTGIDDYAKRLPREWHFAQKELKPETAGSPTSRLQKEAGRISEALDKLGGQPRLIALDERGQDLSTQALADKLRRWQAEAADPVFLIGSADGLAPEIKAQAAERIRLSSLTLPHGIARLLLVEQLYRAATLLAGHPYHRS